MYRSFSVIAWTATLALAVGPLTAVARDGSLPETDRPGPRTPSHMPEHLPPTHLAGPRQIPPPFLLHDLDNGQTTQLNIDCSVGASGTIPGRPGPSAAEDLGARLDKSFYDMGVIDTSTRALYPYSSVVKLLGSFTYGLQGECTGVLVDAQTVMTAGHCIYPQTLEDAGGNQIPILDWASAMVVAPGWDGSGLLASPGVIEPFGVAHATAFAVSSSWVNDLDHDYDVGLIRLDRPVGLLAGWYGMAWGRTCSSYTGNLHQNLSFPAEDCEDPAHPGLHNGTDMYWWFGYIDRCVDLNQLQQDTSPGCFSKGWGGMSGGPLYNIEYPQVFSHAVASTQYNDPSVLNYRRHTSHTIDAACSFIGDTRGSVMDLHALHVTSDHSVTAGQQLEEFGFWVANPTNDYGNRGVTWRVYLSARPYPTQDMVLLTTRTPTVYFSAMDLHGFGTTSGTEPWIPIGTPFAPYGYYYLIVELDPTTDGNPDNNTTMYWDAHEITVYPVIDVLVDWVAAEKGTFEPGDDLEVGFRIINQGGSDSGEVEVEIRASFDTNVGGSFEPILGTFTYPSMASGEAYLITETVTLPCQLDGPHVDQYIGVVVTTAGDVNPTNDDGVDNGPIAFTGLFCDGFEYGNTNRWDSTVP